MPFNSIAFLLVFLPGVLIGAWLAGKAGQGWLKLWLVAASLAFYGLNARAQLPVLLLCVALNLGIVRMMRGGRHAASLAAGGVVANLLVLGWFKYLASMVSPGMPLPPGISFFVFTQIGLLLWLGADPPARIRLLDQALFSTVFPVMLAGPILSPPETLPQFSGRLGVTAEGLAVGLGFFFLGLAKKTLLADPLGGIVAPVFTDPAAAGAIGAWMGALAWYLQLYFDFSGYTDMAIGLGWTIGLRLPDNFEQPYRAGSVIQYWQRWHMSLTRFLMANVHAPVTLAILRRRRRLGQGIDGAAQRSAAGFPVMIAAPIIVTMLLAGVWHGAQWTYVLFGLLHAGFLLVNHAWRLWRGPALPPTLAILLTQAAVLTGAVMFRAETPSEAAAVFAAMTGQSGAGALDLYGLAVGTRLGLLFGIVWLCPTTRAFMQGGAVGIGRSWLERLALLRWQPSSGMALALGGLATLSLLACSGTRTFVYFTF